MIKDSLRLTGNVFLRSGWWNLSKDSTSWGNIRRQRKILNNENAIKSN